MNWVCIGFLSFFKSYPCFLMYIIENCYTEPPSILFSSNTFTWVFFIDSDSAIYYIVYTFHMGGTLAQCWRVALCAFSTLHLWEDTNTTLAHKATVPKLTMQSMPSYAFKDVQIGILQGLVFLTRVQMMLDIMQSSSCSSQCVSSREYVIFVL